MISYRLPVSSLVKLRIYNVLGRIVRTLVNERQTAGIHFVIFNAESLASGAYFYTLRAGTFSKTKKLMILK